MEIRRLYCKQTMVYKAGQILLYTSKILVVAFFAGRSHSRKESLIKFPGSSVHPRACPERSRRVHRGSISSMLLNQGFVKFPLLGWGHDLRSKTCDQRPAIKDLRSKPHRFTRSRYFSMNTSSPFSTFRSLTLSGSLSRSRCSASFFCNTSLTSDAGTERSPILTSVALKVA